MRARIFAALLGIAVFAAPAAAFAQQIPAAPAPAGPAPSYARPGPANGDEAIHGIVSSFDGKYRLQVRDVRGFIDNVEMHQGTIINPTGLTLVPGMAVTILGLNRGNTFAANEIDTPYQTMYGYAPRGYGYPVSIGIGLNFGSGYYHHWH